jgi:hypothetical protein
MAKRNEFFRRILLIVGCCFGTQKLVVWCSFMLMPSTKMGQIQKGIHRSQQSSQCQMPNAPFDFRKRKLSENERYAAFWEFWKVARINAYPNHACGKSREFKRLPMPRLNSIIG